MTASVEAVKERKKAAAEEAAQLQPKLKLIVEKTRELQGQVYSVGGSRGEGRGTEVRKVNTRAVNLHIQLEGFQLPYLAAKGSFRFLSLFG